jgi:hypothetical protein
MVSTTAFVVNLPLLRPGTILHEALVADGFPVDSTSLDVSTWFEEVTRLTHRDLPEFVPITSTATEELTEHTIMRANHRVYIINDVAMPSQFDFPFVIHWNYAYGGIALHALVVTKDIQLPVLDYQPRFSLQYIFATWSRAKWASSFAQRCYWHVHTLAVASSGPAIAVAIDPYSANGTPSAGISLLSRRSSRAKPPEEAQLARHRPLSGVTNSTLSRPKVFFQDGW